MKKRKKKTFFLAILVLIIIIYSLQLIKQIKSPIKIYSNYKDEKINLNYSKKIENFMQSIKKNSTFLFDFSLLFR